MKKIWQNLPGFFPSPKAYLSSLVHYNPKSKDARIWELDVLRGLVILYLTFDGFCRIIFRFPISWQTEFGKSFYSFLVQYNGGAFQSGVNPFVNYFLCFLSGITTCLTGSPLRKTGRFALFYLACWGIYALVSYLLQEYCYGYVLFDILAVLAVSNLLWLFLDAVRCPTWLRAIMTVLLFCIGVTFHYNTFMSGEEFGVEQTFLSLFLYNRNGYLVAGEFFQPLLPHLGFFMLGGILGKYLYADKKTLTKRAQPPKALYPVVFCGKHYCAILLLVPAVLVGIVYAIIAIVRLV